MKLFASKFYQTLIFNIATISAIVVGTYQFLIRAYNDQEGNEKVRRVVVTVLRYINTLTGQIYASLQHDVPVVKVAQKTTKRRWLLVYYIRNQENHVVLPTHNAISFHSKEEHQAALYDACLMIVNTYNQSDMLDDLVYDGVSGYGFMKFARNILNSIGEGNWNENSI